MENVNLALFIILLFIIPLGMLFTGIAGCEKHGTYFPAVIVKFLGASVIHLIVSGLAGIAFHSINSVITSNQASGQDKIFAQTVALLIILAYTFIGWLLCSFVGGKFVRSMNDFGFSEKKQFIP